MHSYGIWLVHTRHDSYYVCNMTHSHGMRRIHMGCDAFIWDMTCAYETWLMPQKNAGVGKEVNESKSYVTHTMFMCIHGMISHTWIFGSPHIGGSHVSHMMIWCVLYMCIYIYMCVMYMHVYIYLYVYIYTFLTYDDTMCLENVFIYIYVFCIRMYMCISLYDTMCFVYVYIRVYVLCMCMDIYVSMYDTICFAYVNIYIDICVIYMYVYMYIYVWYYVLCTCIYIYMCVIYMYVYISLYIYIYIYICIYTCLTYYDTKCVHSVFGIKTNLRHVQCTVCVYAKCALNYRAVPAKNTLE